MNLENTKITTKITGEADLPRVSVTFQRRVDVADYGKDARTLSKTITMTILPDGSLNGDLQTILKQADIITEALKTDVEAAAKKLITEPTVKETPIKPTVGNSRYSRRGGK